MKDRNQIKDIVLAVTNKCNGRCQFCNIWKDKKESSCLIEDYKRLPAQARNIEITGGEPFLRDDLLDIVKTISRQTPKAKITILTNGFLPSKIKQTMQRVIRFRKNIGLAVSLDGFGKVHEELRGFPGGYCLAIETIRLLKELGLKDLRITFTLGDNNVNQLKKVYRLSKELGVKFNLALYHDSAHHFKKQNNRVIHIRKIKRELAWLAEQELRSFSPQRWLRAYFAWALVRFLETDRRVLPDYSGLYSLFIDSDGSIYPSEVWALKIGQLQRMNKTNNWPEFSQRTQEMISVDQSPGSWMIPTVRRAMQKHWPEVMRWILQEKFCLYTKGRKYVFKAKKKHPAKQLNLFLKKISSIF